MNVITNTHTHNLWMIMSHKRMEFLSVLKKEWKENCQLRITFIRVDPVRGSGPTIGFKIKCLPSPTRDSSLFATWTKKMNNKQLQMKTNQDTGNEYYLIEWFVPTLNWKCSWSLNFIKPDENCCCFFILH
jgi:hypothetical protein